jgi:hypothetical protein
MLILAPFVPWRINGQIYANKTMALPDLRNPAAGKPVAVTHTAADPARATPAASTKL